MELPPLTPAGIPTGPASVLLLRFDDWGKTHPKYRKQFIEMSAEFKGIFRDALHEMRDVKPGTFWEWWTVNHNRYIRSKWYRQKAMQDLHELAYQFLTDYHYGRLAKPTAAASGSKSAGAPRNRAG